MIQRKNNIGEVEKRTMAFEVRAQDEETEGRTIEGYAALFGEETDMGWYREIIEPGAFDQADLSDVRALFNHDANLILARTASGTLTLSVDERGLKYSFTVPNTTLGNDLLEMVRRGDISQSSFAFIIDEQSWEIKSDEETELRRITKIQVVYDVAPVTYPAYETTTVTARSYEAWKKNLSQPDVSAAVEQHWENYLQTVV